MEINKIFRDLWSLIYSTLKKPMIPYIAIFIFILFFSLFISPYFNPIPNRDSGVFLYVAEGILNGEIPYLDIWDHKPPLIYFINAMALQFSHSLWAIWCIEVLSITVASFLCYSILNKHFGNLTAFFATIIFILSFFHLGVGNYTEEYSLPLIFLIIYLFTSDHNQTLKYSLIGIVSGILFTLKPNLIGIFITIVVLTLLYGYMHKISIKKEFTLLSLFFCVPVAIFGLYFYANDALFQSIDAIIFYNIQYSSTPILTKLFYAIEIIHQIDFIWLFAAATWIILASHAVYHRNIWNEKLLSLAIISFPIECVFVAISGRPFGHYAFTLLPVCIILFGYLIYNFSEIQKSNLFCVKYTPKSLITVLLVLLLLYSPMIPLYSAVTHNPGVDNRMNAINYITTHSNSSDYVLIWGAETGINVLADRQSPSRYVYQWPLYTKGYSSNSYTQKFLQDLINNQPKLIIDMHSCDAIVPPLNKSERLNWAEEADLGLQSKYGISGRYQVPDSFDMVFQYINDNYEYIETIDNSEYSVYRIRDR